MTNDEYVELLNETFRVQFPSLVNCRVYFDGRGVWLIPADLDCHRILPVFRNDVSDVKGDPIDRNYILPMLGRLVKHASMWRSHLKLPPLS